MAVAQPTLDERITTVTARIAQITARLSIIPSIIDAETRSYNDWANAGNWTEAKRHSDAVNALTSEQASITNERTNLNETLALLQEQKAIQLTAQQALVNQVNANASVTNAQGSLSPEQLLQIQLAKIESDKLLKAEALSAGQIAENEKLIQDEKAKTKRTYLYVGIVVVVFVIGAFIYFKTKK